MQGWLRNLLELSSKELVYINKHQVALSFWKNGRKKMIEKQKEDHTVAGPQHKFGKGIIDMTASGTSYLSILDALYLGQSAGSCSLEGSTCIYIGTCLIFGIWHPVLAWYDIMIIYIMLMTISICFRDKHIQTLEKYLSFSLAAQCHWKEKVIKKKANAVIICGKHPCEP